MSLVLATPVVLWAGLPFHRAAWANLRHGTATMDTLISMGTLAAYLWSVYALVFGTAGEAGMAEGFRWLPERGDPTGTIYLETAAGVTAFLLAGRYAEARARRRSGDALRALLQLGRQGRRGAAATASRRGSRSSRSRSATGSSSVRARRSPPTARSSTARPRSTRAC